MTPAMQRRAQLEAEADEAIDQWAAEVERRRALWAEAAELRTGDFNTDPFVRKAIERIDELMMKAFEAWDRSVVLLRARRVDEGQRALSAGHGFYFVALRVQQRALAEQARGAGEKRPS